MDPADINFLYLVFNLKKCIGWMLRIQVHIQYSLAPIAKISLSPPGQTKHVLMITIFSIIMHSPKLRVSHKLQADVLH